MSVASSLALAMAERVAESVETKGGPRAGLVAWKALAGNASDTETRARALLAALRCAVILRDQSALGELSSKWRSVDRGIWDEPIAVLCNKMTRAGMLPRAIELAHAEAQRARTARALYLYARCLELGQVTSECADAPIAAAFEEAIVRAAKEGACDIEVAGRVRRLAILSRSWMTMAEALDEARGIDLAQVSVASKLVIVRIQLVSSSRFVRAAAIDTLDEIVRAAAESRDMQDAAA